MLRRRFEQTQSLEERLAEEAKRLREEASTWRCTRCAFAQSPTSRNRLSPPRMAFVVGPSASKVSLELGSPPYPRRAFLRLI
jgi:hypothetical protein